MPTVIPFPARRDPFGEAVELTNVCNGIAVAAAQGVPDASLQAILNQDRPLATYALQLLGSPDQTDRRHGRLMLSRMAGSLAAPIGNPPSAA